jgi:hypothetical protein
MLFIPRLDARTSWSKHALRAPPRAQARSKKLSNLYSSNKLSTTKDADMLCMLLCHILKAEGLKESGRSPFLLYPRRKNAKSPLEPSAHGEDPSRPS